MADVKPQTEQVKMTKNEAVRQAMAHLGDAATRGQIRSYVLDTFGLEMSPDHISTAKGEILRKSGKAKSPAVKKPTARPAPTTAAAPRHTPTANSSAINLEDILTLHNLIKRVGAGQLRTLIDVVSKR